MFFWVSSLREWLSFDVCSPSLRQPSSFTRAWDRLFWDNIGKVDVFISNHSTKTDMGTRQISGTDSDSSIRWSVMIIYTYYFKRNIYVLQLLLFFFLPVTQCKGPVLTLYHSDARKQFFGKHFWIIGVCSFFQVGLLLLESILLLGYFSLFHPGNQAVLRWGKSPTILHKVNSYFM